MRWICNCNLFFVVECGIKVFDRTPLHLAVIKGNKRIVEFLLKKQANIYLEVNYNNITMTALDIAQANKNKEIEQLLLSFIIGTDYISE
ncbi:MAG: ankyrin repeat domain-containing protein [Wolbachia endosymbiont of Xenopsylla cheopis]